MAVAIVVENLGVKHNGAHRGIGLISCRNIYISHGSMHAAFEEIGDVLLGSGGNGGSAFLKMLYVLRTIEVGSVVRIRRSS